MGIVLLCLILGLAIAIERIIYLNLSTSDSEKLTAEVEFKFMVPPLNVTPVVLDRAPVTVNVPADTVVAPE